MPKSRSKPKSKSKKIDWDKFWEEYCSDPHSYDDIFCIDPPRFEDRFEDD